MSPADHATTSATELVFPLEKVRDKTGDTLASPRQRLAGLLILLAVAFLSSVVSSFSSAYREPLSKFADAYIRLSYLNYLIRELSSIALLFYVIRQNQQKLSDFGLTFRAREIVYGILLWAGVISCYRLAYPTVLSNL
jgi:hypothetical protein